MSTRHWVAAGLAAVVTLSVGTGCAKEQSSGGDDSSQIVIGADLELSGPAAVQGEAYQRALKMVQADINKTGIKVGDKTKKVKLVIRDNKSDPAESLTVAKSLINNDHVAAIVGAGASPTTMPMIPVAEKAKIPMISMGSSGAIVNPVQKYVFKTPGNTDVIGNVMMKAFAKKKIKKIAVLSVDNPYGEAGLKEWQALDKAGKIDLVTNQKFSDSVKDLSVQATKVTAAKPDAVVVWAIPPQSGLAAKALRQKKFPGDKVYYDTGAGSELFVKGAGAASEGSYMVHSRVLAGNEITATTPAAQTEKNFFTEYSAKYGGFSGFAPMAADALNLIIAAIKKGGSADPQDIQKSLENLSYDGAFGTYQFSPTNHGGVSESSLTVLQVKNGTWSLSDLG